ncbi:MAG TPA: hypothetical protein GXX37_13750 [Clostridiaceae bacterium]|nr:hypothetical protein [Clostridiaceae bacterium]
MREKFLLTGSWQFQLDPKELGEQLQWMSSEFNREHWLFTEVPNALDDFGAKDNPLRGYEGTTWFSRTFFVSETWNKKDIYLVFEGANYLTKVWINGKFIGTHEGGYTRFSFKIPNDIINFKYSNLLVVKTENKSLENRTPGPIFGWWNQGGIYREVYLESRPKLHISDLTVRTYVKSENEARFELDVEVKNTTEISRKNIEVSWKLFDNDKQITGAGSTNMSLLYADESRKINFTADIKNPNLWCPENPYLYNLQVKVTDGDITDTMQLSVGIREISVDGTKILLNGKEIVIKGVNRHEDYPDSGRVHNLQWLIHDFNHLKSLGVNFIRNSHYPNHPEFYEMADKYGFLVMNEVPLYFWGEMVRNTSYKDMSALEAAEAQLREMINRDKNHPCIIMWSVSNETRGGRKHVDDGNRYLMDCARKLDPTRLVTHVSNHWYKLVYGYVDGALDADDVICINEYFGAYSKSLGGAANTIEDIPIFKEALEKALEDLRSRHPDKPIIVSEFGGIGIAGFRGNAYPSEDYQAAFVKQHLEVLTNFKNIRGIVYWDYTDYPYHKKFVFDYFPVGYYGLVTRDRRPKKVCDVIKEYFKRWNC